jgi:hypothetical protein
MTLIGSPNMPRSGSNSWFLAVSPINGYGICAKLASDRIYSPPDQLVTGWMAVERGTKPYLQAPAMDSPQQGGAAPRSRPESLRR